MRTMKKLLALLLVVCMLLSVMPAAFAAPDVCDPFTDVQQNSWYHSGIHYALEQGLMNGSGTKFNPNASPDPTVSHATVLVNGRAAPGSPASRLTRNTVSTATMMPILATSAGRSPRLRPTATGTPATRMAVSGDTTEIGPAPNAA